MGTARSIRGEAGHPTSSSGTRNTRNLGNLLGVLPTLLITGLALAQAPLPNLPPVPPENPITEPKRVLGKMLFFEEQLSTANMMSCATCHMPGRNGTDPRIGRNPGPDTVFNTPDDKLASPGVVRSNSANDFIRDAIFGVTPQVTARTAPTMINSGFAPQLFWDGRASGQFTDPQTNQVVIAVNGALESQSVLPPLSDVEKAHEGVDWTMITAKLARVRPLDLATNLPADVAAALAGNPDYPELFRRAFGDPQITARRVAFALATYQRTLVSNQTPWDTNTLTAQQQRGFNAFQANCSVCHTPPLFSNNTFRNVGLRPPAEDLGRQLVTNNPADRGRFRVPSVRNVALKASFMHNGQFSTLTDVLRFYARAPGAAPQFPDNRDPAMGAINLPPQAATDVQEFLTNGLRDPRVANEQFPFDRPTLWSQRIADRPAPILGTNVPGSGGVIPRIIIDSPGMIGNAEFRVGLDGGLGGAVATLWVSTSPPVAGALSQPRSLTSMVIPGGGPNQVPVTHHWPLGPSQVIAGQTLYFQWSIEDASAAGGVAKSDIVQVPIICGARGCPPACYANCDGSATTPTLNALDFACFLGQFQNSRSADLNAQLISPANCDGSSTVPVLNALDFACFLQRYQAGCP